MISIDQLSLMLQPPTLPLHSKGDWTAIERQLGVQLPKDYKDFIGLYGQGKICRSLWIDDYLAPPNTNIVEDIIVGYLRSFEEAREAGSPMPYPLFPSPNGLLPCGGIENGGIISWKTEGKPDDWDVVVWSSDLDEFFPAKGLSLVAFLNEVMSQRWQGFHKVFESELFSKPVFVPFD